MAETLEEIADQPIDWTHLDASRQKISDFVLSGHTKRQSERILNRPDYMMIKYADSEEETSYVPQTQNEQLPSARYSFKPGDAVSLSTSEITFVDGNLEVTIGIKHDRRSAEPYEFSSNNGDLARVHGKLSYAMQVLYEIAPLFEEYRELISSRLVDNSIRFNFRSSASREVEFVDSWIDIGGNPSAKGSPMVMLGQHPSIGKLSINVFEGDYQEMPALCEPVRPTGRGTDHLKATIVGKTPKEALEHAVDIYKM